MPSSGSAIQLYKMGSVKFSLQIELFPGVGGWGMGLAEFGNKMVA